MSSVLDMYADRLENISCDRGFSELGLVLRRGKTQDPYTISDHKNFFFDTDTKFNNGDIITRLDYKTNDSYIVIAKQISADNTCIQGKRINGTLNICRLVEQFDEKHRRTGVTEDVVYANVPTYCESQSVSMRFLDAGFQPNTIKNFFVQVGKDIRILDRIKFEGKNYQVDNVDTVRYRDVLVVQVSEDTR